MADILKFTFYCEYSSALIFVHTVITRRAVFCTVCSLFNGVFLAAWDQAWLPWSSLSLTEASEVTIKVYLDLILRALLWLFASIV